MAKTIKKTFEEWLAEVDRLIRARVFLGVNDLPDCCYRDWYDDGVTPKGAASKAIRNAME